MSKFLSGTGEVSSPWTPEEGALKLYKYIADVRKVSLHEGQADIARAYFKEKYRIIMSQWGRNAGKTECALFCAWLAAILNPGWYILIVCPERSQGKKIYWDTRRLQSYGPAEFVEKTANLQVLFKNKSLISIEGSRNTSGLRGVKPNLVIYDEFQDHSEEFDVEVMTPNLAGKASSLLIFGTPPKRSSSYYAKFWQDHQLACKRAPMSYYYKELPTSVNPSIDKEFLRHQREKLARRGEERIYLREYEAKLIFGGEEMVFPMWDPIKFIRPHSVVSALCLPNANKLKFWTILDPSNSAFAVLFLAHNPYTCELYFLDEIYETNRHKTSAQLIWKRILEKERELYPGAPIRSWRRVYDEAAAWFRNEIQSAFKNESLNPTKKHGKNFDMENQISLFKDILLAKKLIMSDRCKVANEQIESYITNENGEYPRNFDDLIDCIRYFLDSSNYKFIEKIDPSEDKAFEQTATFGEIGMEMKQVKEGDDWTDFIDGDIGDYFHGF